MSKYKLIDGKRIAMAALCDVYMLVRACEDTNLIKPFSREEFVSILSVSDIVVIDQSVNRSELSEYLGVVKKATPTNDMFISDECCRKLLRLVAVVAAHHIEGNDSWQKLRAHGISYRTVSDARRVLNSNKGKCVIIRNGDA